MIVCLIYFISFAWFGRKLTMLHNFEFKKHKREWVLTGVIISLSLIMESLLMFFFYWYILYNAHYESTVSHYTPWYDIKAQFWVCMVVLNLVELMPFYAFLIKTTIYPAHDCFTCFNKDPERRYSIYQYSDTEWK